MDTVRERYLHADSRPEKSRTLDEYYANTGQNRKPLYGSRMVAALAHLSEIFKYSYGGRLK
ncbi:MAG TPA: hypothetical protein VF370_04705 [Candidatus Cryosericum sp.]